MFESSCLPSCYLKSSHSFKGVENGDVGALGQPQDPSLSLFAANAQNFRSFMRSERKKFCSV